MGIVGDHPEGGIRFDLTRADGGPPWAYAGSAFTRDERLALRATVDDGGGVVVLDEASLPREVVQRLTLLLKTAWKHANGNGKEGTGGPPRRIHRWRAE
jgi:hypothetical protein